MATAPRTQIPLKLEFLGRDNKLSQPWAFYLQTLDANLPPIGGSGFVVDGTAGTTGVSTIYQGLAANRGSFPSTNDIYLATDTGQIFTVQAGNWQEQLPQITGDATKPAFSHVITFNTINATPGTFGDGSNIPVVSVNEKGLITGVTSVPVLAPPVIVPGSFGDTIFKGLTSTGFETFDHLNKDTFTVTYTFEYHYGDASPEMLFTLPVGRRIIRAIINVEQAFDDAASTLSLGTISLPASIFATTDVAPVLVGAFENQPNTSYVVDTDIYMYITPGTATQGSGFVSITLSS